MTMITMGNDEFILYMRKNERGSEISNKQLGKLIWIWIQQHSDHDHRRVTQEDKPCHWGETGEFINEHNLPKTATQFEFDRSILPQLYSYLDSL